MVDINELLPRERTPRHYRDLAGDPRIDQEGLRTLAVSPHSFVRVAVAVKKVPVGVGVWKLKPMMPAAGSVSPAPPSVIVTEPRNVCPSPFPEGSAAALAKNSIRNSVLAMLLSFPWIVVVPLLLVTDARSG